MTELVCVDGTVIELLSNSLVWGWGTSSLSVTTFGNTKDVTISGSGIRLTVDGKAVILQSDIISDMSNVTDSYHSLTAGLWSNISPAVGGLDGTVSVVTLTSGLTPSTLLKHVGNGVILDNVSGNFSIVHIIPSGVLAAPPPAVPIPDVVVVYTGTWSIKSNGGNTKLKTN